MKFYNLAVAEAKRPVQRVCTISNHQSILVMAEQKYIGKDRQWLSDKAEETRLPSDKGIKRQMGFWG